MIKHKFLTLLVALCATSALWASNVITYTATEKLIETTSEMFYLGGLSVDAFNTSITSHEFSNGIGTITFADEVTTIGYGAFSYYLNSITIPNSVTTIENWAFFCCNDMTITIGNSVTTIGDDAFHFEGGFFVEVGLAKTNYTGTIADWCKIEFEGSRSNPISLSHNFFINDVEIKDLVIPEGVDKIGNYAFEGCYSLTSVTIPNSVTMIGYRAFDGVHNIEYNGTAKGSPWGAKCVNGYVDGYLVYSDATKTKLCGCSSAAIGEITIPNSVTTIGERAFDNCSGLTSITIPNSVTTIGDYAFDGCYGLTSVTIGNSVTSIGSYAFYGCYGLTSVIIGNSVTTIGDDAFSRCSNLTSVTISNSVTTIGDYAFGWCESLTSVTIPNSVKTIGDYAFAGCYSLTSVTIPNSTRIGYEAFDGCYNIKSVNVMFSPFEMEYNATITKNFDSSILSKKLQCVGACCISPTCASVTVDLTNFDVSKYAKMCLDYRGQKYALQAGVNTILLTGMCPNTVNDLVFFSQLPGATDWIDGYKITITTPALELTTLMPKVVSEGNVVVAASTNISDYETNVGFEWRKDNAPEGSASKSGAAIICNGIMEGRLLNLGTDWWKVRPYYEAADGTRYYGDWAYIDPTDASYFEPTVHTYAMPTSPTGNQVQVRGYVMTGTDEVTEQGFEYWFNSDPKAPSRIPAATPDSIYRVTASGQVMTAVLKDLAYSTTYTCRAYAVADGKTYYGEEVQFLTPEDPRPIYTLTLDAGIGGQVNIEAAGQYREGEQVTLRATADKGYVFVQWSDLNTENPRTITMTSDITLSAIFEEGQPQDVENVDANTNTHVSKFIINGQILIIRDGKTYNALGQEL